MTAAQQNAYDRCQELFAELDAHKARLRECYPQPVVRPEWAAVMTRVFGERSDPVAGIDGYWDGTPTSLSVFLPGSKSSVTIIYDGWAFVAGVPVGGRIFTLSATVLADLAERVAFALAVRAA